MRAVFGLVVSVIACGDNTGEPPPDEPCEPPAGELPLQGMYIDPYAVPLPAGCVMTVPLDRPARAVPSPRRWFRLEPAAFEGSLEEAADMIRGRFLESVELHLRRDALHARVLVERRCLAARPRDPPNPASGSSGLETRRGLPSTISRGNRDVPHENHIRRRLEKSDAA